MKKNKHNHLFFLLLAQILMKFQWLRHTETMIISLGYCCQSSLICRENVI